ncbi:MAG: hypothetical protein RR060_00660 [Victivallaceae bacterium]
MKVKLSKYYLVATLLLLGCSNNDKPIDPIAAARHRASDDMPIASRSSAAREQALQQAAGNNANSSTTIAAAGTTANSTQTPSANAAESTAPATPLPPPRRRTRAEYYQARYGASNEGQPFGMHWRNAEAADFIYIVPANLGMAVFTAVGNVLCWPFSIGYELGRGNNTMNALVPPLGLARDYFGYPGAYILGGPFWALKKGFVDFPVWLFSSSDDAK